ncbi:hypothetical protein HY484_04120, partial [Candidatus Woesearchaeota archaeon]|nr:hypothetical protein [Candidatus Woesearchaeota archaeon]
YEKYYTKDELLKEVKNAGLKPIKTTTDFHMHGILATTHLKTHVEGLK